MRFCSVLVAVAAARLACLACLACLAGSGCHVVAYTETTRPIRTERIMHSEGAIAHRPTIVVTDAGQLRFVEPLECPSEEIIQQRTLIETEIRPNLATFTVGVLALAAGGVMLTSGLFAARPAASPFTYVGLAGIGIGGPLAIGPWIGDRTERGAGDSRSVRRPGPSQPCGERGFAATSATLAISGLEIHGAVDRDGVFAISPFAWVDAYSAAQAVSAAVTARLETRAGPRTIEAVLDADALARRAASFRAHADFDARVEPLVRVPGIAGGTIAASLVRDAGEPAVRVVLALRNDGPGDAWGLRGQINAPAVPAIDGRIIYVGALGKAATSRALTIPVTAAAAAALRGQTIEFSVELRDAHGTAPATPIRFRGAIGDSGP